MRAVIDSNSTQTVSHACDDKMIIECARTPFKLTGSLVRFVSLYALLISVAACGPAFTDGDYSIAGAPDFYYSDTGGDGKFLSVRKDGRLTILIGARVDEYFVREGKIFLSRRPVKVVLHSDHSESVIQSTCEFWLVDIKTKSASIQPKPFDGLKCLRPT